MIIFKIITLTIPHKKPRNYVDTDLLIKTPRFREVG